MEAGVADRLTFEPARAADYPGTSARIGSRPRLLTLRSRHLYHAAAMIGES